VETFSVICQVAYFKLTKPYTPEKPMSPLSLAIYKLRNKLPGEGKRLLRMAPMHHHFEAVAAEKGHKEWQVVVCFWIVQALLCSLCLAGFSV
jgi:phospho-N-acetylmuramoyl-pentapeptide-transferase